MGDRDQVSREQAKRLVHEAEFGYLVVGQAEQIPVLGSVEDMDEIKMKIDIESYKFGDTEKAEQ